MQWGFLFFLFGGVGGGSNKWWAALTCGRKQRPGKVLWIMEAWKHSRGWRSAEQVKFTAYLELVGIQLHLLPNNTKTVSLCITFFFNGRRRKGVEACSCLALPGRVSKSDSSSSGHVPQPRSDSIYKAISLHSLSAACLIHMNKVWSERSAPQHTLEHATRYTERAAPREQSAVSAWQKNILRAESCRQKPWELGDGLVWFAFPVWKERDVFRLCLSSSQHHSAWRYGERDEENWLRVSPRGYFYPSPTEVSVASPRNCT